MKYVIDSSALIALLWNEHGGLVTAQLIDDPDSSCFIHVINLCEVYYDFIRRAGETQARDTIEDLSSILFVRDDLDSEFWKHAGEYKAELKRVSLADCFCLTLAKRLNANLVTADHHEFDIINTQRIISVKFIR